MKKTPFFILIASACFAGVNKVSTIHTKESRSLFIAPDVMAYSLCESYGSHKCDLVIENLREKTVKKFPGLIGGRDAMLATKDETLLVCGPTVNGIAQVVALDAEGKSINTAAVKTCATGYDFMGEESSTKGEFAIAYFDKQKIEGVNFFNSRGKLLRSVPFPKGVNYQAFYTIKKGVVVVTQSAAANQPNEILLLDKSGNVNATYAVKDSCLWLDVKESKLLAFERLCDQTIEPQTLVITFLNDQLKKTKQIPLSARDWDYHLLAGRHFLVGFSKENKIFSFDEHSNELKSVSFPKTQRLGSLLPLDDKRFVVKLDGKNSGKTYFAIYTFDLKPIRSWAVGCVGCQGNTFLSLFEEGKFATQDDDGFVVFSSDGSEVYRDNNLGRASGNVFFDLCHDKSDFFSARFWTPMPKRETFFEVLQKDQK